MVDSKRTSRARKPSARVRSERKAAMGLPPELPLLLHGSGRWVKKVRGKLHYFGKTTDDSKGAAALLRWLDQGNPFPAVGVRGLTSRVSIEGHYSCANRVDGMACPWDSRSDSRVILERGRSPARWTRRAHIERRETTRLARWVGHSPQMSIQFLLRLWIEEAIP
jgi:hypothetical protein